MANIPTVNLSGGTDNTFKTVQLAPYAMGGLGQSPFYPSGRIFPLVDYSNVSGAAVAAANTLYLFPFSLAIPFNYSAGKLRVTTGGANSIVKGGIWAASQLNLYPVGAPVAADNTGAATTGSGVDVALAFGNGTLSAGLYWAGSVYQATLPTMQCISGGVHYNHLIGGASNMLAIFGLSIAQTIGNPLPTFAEGTSFTEDNTGNVPNIALVAQ